jgi:capsular polysaccharide biosynthesis protein
LKSEDIDLREYFRIVRRRLWLILLIVPACTIGAAYFSYSTYVPLYSAQTKLYVNNAEAVDPFSRGIMTIGQMSASNGVIDTYKEIIRTPIIMDKVVDRYPQLDASTDELIRSVSVHALGNTSVMIISVVDWSHERAVMMVNAITDVFVTELPKISPGHSAVLLTEAKMSAYPQPVNEQHNTYIILAFVGSLIVSVGIAILLDVLDDRIKDEADVVRVLGVSTLAVVPKTRLRSGRARSRKGTQGRIGEEAYAAIK